MRNEQNAVLDSLIRVQNFLDAHTDVLTVVNASTRKQLDDVVTKLSSLSVEQESGNRDSIGETARQQAARLTLRRVHMAPIAELAKLKLRQVPEFAALRLPRANTTPRRTVAAAYAMADAATPHAATLIEAGLPAAFADNLRAAAATVLDSIAGRSEHLNRRGFATSGLAAEEKVGRSMLRVLNALVLGSVGDDPQMMSAWNGAKLVRQKSGKTSGSGTSGTPVVTPVTPSTPTLVTSTPPVLTAVVTPVFTSTVATPTPVAPPAAVAA